MNPIHRIHLQDGPEDGRKLSPALLRELLGIEGRMTEELSLYRDGAESSGRNLPVFVGSYRLGDVHDGTATYRWHAA